LCAGAAILIGSFFGAYVAMNSQRIFPAAQTVVIYGRDTCGFTSAMRERLTDEHIPFIYANIDNSFVNEEMWHHLKKNAAAGQPLHTAHLPVVLINHQVLERPEETEVIKERSLAVETVEANHSSST
jgi:glutaredoxin